METGKQWWLGVFFRVMAGINSGNSENTKEKNPPNKTTTKSGCISQTSAVLPLEELGKG